MHAVKKHAVFEAIRQVHDEMREHVGYLVSNHQQYAALRLEAYADDLAKILELEWKRVRRSHTRAARS